MSTYSEWTTTQQQTERPIAPVAEYALTRIPLKIVNPRPTSELGANSRYSFNHSTMEYQVPIGILGGRPPFTFNIEGIGTIEGKAPDWNPGMVSWAVVTVPANTSGDYTVFVQDVDGDVQSVSVNVTVDDSRFCFVSNTGSSGGSGSIGDPIDDCSTWFGADYDTVSPFVNSIVVYRGGSYNAPTESGQVHIRYKDTKPLSHIGYPGEEATISLPYTGDGRRGFTNNPHGEGANHYLPDQFWANLTLAGGANWFNFYSTCFRQVWWKLHMRDVNPSYWGGHRDNLGGLIYHNGDHRYVSCIDNLFEDCLRMDINPNNTSCLQFYQTSWLNLDGNTYNRVAWGHCSYIKSRNQVASVTSESFWSDGASSRAPVYHPNSHNHRDQPNNFQPPDIGVPEKDNIIHVRYSRYYTLNNIDDSYVTQNEITSNGGWDFSDSYVERCVMLGVWGNRSVSKVNGHTPYVVDSGYFARPRWESHLLHPDYQVENSIIDHSDNYGSFCDNHGRFTSEAYRYKIGWEVP